MKALCLFICFSTTIVCAQTQLWKFSVPLPPEALPNVQIDSPLDDGSHGAAFTYAYFPLNGPGETHLVWVSRSGKVRLTEQLEGGWRVFRVSPSVLLLIDEDEKVIRRYTIVGKRVLIKNTSFESNEGLLSGRDGLSSDFDRNGFFTIKTVGQNNEIRRWKN